MSESESRQTVLIGPEGLRAGWRLLIFLSIVAALYTPVVIFVQPSLQRLMGNGLSARNLIMGDSVNFMIIMIATAVMARIEDRGLTQYGLPLSGLLGKQFRTGAQWGFIMLSCIVGAMAVTHAYAPGTIALAPAAILKYAVVWAVAFFITGVFEEFALRGYMQFTLTTGLGFWPAALITSIIFAALHGINQGETMAGLIEIVLIALFLCLALRRTGNLWFAVGWHMAFDWGESFFYSTPNSGIQANGHLWNATLQGSKWLSGGTVGPEASIFDLIVTVAGILLFLRMYPTAKYPEGLTGEKGLQERLIERPG